MIWFLSAVKSILTIFREMFLGISSNCSYMTITALPVFRSNIFSWNNFISPFSQGYFQQSKLPSSFTAWKFMWCWMPSSVCWIQNKLLESNDFPHAPIIFGQKVTWLWHWCWKCEKGRMPAKCPERKWEFCWSLIYVLFYLFLVFLFVKKRDPDDDDCNEFDGENVGRQNVSKGNENCAGRS